MIQDANGYRLALVSNNSGAPGDIKMSNNTTGLNFTKAVTGKNAALTGGRRAAQQRQQHREQRNQWSNAKSGIGFPKYAGYDQRKS